MQHVQSTPVPSARLLDIPALSALLGVSKRTCKRLATAQAIPGITRIGKCLRFDRNKVEAWIEKGCPGVRKIDAK
jgi:excisionase family DNA binding protein